MNVFLPLHSHLIQEEYAVDVDLPKLATQAETQFNLDYRQFHTNVKLKYECGMVIYSM